MADVFDIDSTGYHGHQKRDDYNHRSSGGWVPVETNSVSRKDPRLARRDDGRKQYSEESPRRSPQRMSKTSSQMYNQMSQAQSYPQAPPPPMYSEYNSGYGVATTSYTHNYQQSYQQSQSNTGFNQYNQQSSYPSQSQGYNSGQHQQPGPPGEEYPNSWAPVPPSYAHMSHPPPPPVPRSSSVASTAHTSDSKNDDLKKEAGIAQELKQQRATLIKQRDEYLRKASVLRRELDKLRMQKHELLADKSPPRDSQRILRENAKLQLEIQNKLKSINNVVDMLSGIIGDGMKAGDEEQKANSSDSSPKRARKPTEDTENEEADARSGKARERERERGDEEEWPHYNYIHYDPELHWCRVCDVFPRSAKDFLNHLHSAEHRQVTQEHQLVDTPWHKLPTDPELPSYKGAPVKRVPIKGLQFFISATSWYCKLCDVWIGDLHCASLHLKSKNHSHNYSNFVEQNPHWETNWLKDREKAFTRCTKNETGLVPPAPEPPVIKEKLNKKQLKNLKDKDSSFLEASKEKKRKKKSKKRKKNNSSDSSSSSSSSDSSSEDESDKAKSIRVAMRNKMRMQAQMILNEEIGGKLEALRGLVEDKRSRETVEELPPQQESVIEDNIINQWMTVTTNNDKHILDNLKGRLKQRQELDKEKSIEAAAEQRRREREREERELKEMREREQRELEEKMREEREREERDREERERIKERERNRRKRRSGSRSPERERYPRGRSHSRGRSRSRSVGRRRYSGRGRSPDRYFREERRDGRDTHRSPEDKFKPRKVEYEDDDYDKHEDYKGKGKRLVSTLASSRKLPFIGRMPLFKKRGDGEEKEIKKEDYEIRLSKFEPGNTARAFIPEPGVVHITKLATPQEFMPLQCKITAENPPPPPKIIPEPPQISETAPPPPMINDVVTTVVEEIGMDVQDMELDEAAPPLPPGVPVAEAKPLAKPAGNHLPRDFQDALNIIFPGDHPHANDPNLMLQYQYQMGYGMMYPGMQMYDYSATTEETAVVAETIESKEATAEIEQTEEKTDTAQPGVDDKEDLAMLGIDAEDMAAQTF